MKNTSKEKHETVSNSYPEARTVKMVLFPNIGGSCIPQHIISCSDISSTKPIRTTKSFRITKNVIYQEEV
jgi:hypothetical protein